MSKQFTVISIAAPGVDGLLPRPQPLLKGLLRQGTPPCKWTWPQLHTEALESRDTGELRKSPGGWSESRQRQDCGWMRIYGWTMQKARSSPSSLQSARLSESKMSARDLGGHGAWLAQVQQARRVRGRPVCKQPFCWPRGTILALKPSDLFQGGEKEAESQVREAVRQKWLLLKLEGTAKLYWTGETMVFCPWQKSKWT